MTLILQYSEVGLGVGWLCSAELLILRTDEIQNEVVVDQMKLCMCYSRYMVSDLWLCSNDYVVISG